MANLRLLVLFENSIFTILPPGIFLLLAPLRAQHLLAAPVRVKQTSMYSAKIVSSRLSGGGSWLKV